ncbi:MAG: bifunctional DNA-formamidopyrimidine glycosylase/DNA-(apurinic or apyrimidinic site) lyase [Bdellovibrionaceae bacterium]|nr:bifunctional DNA-formamidopyrimidine glycosylase/DNA-(apurinic or apyrimidinic site) lyase [Bdellovibrionales bacterium]MCB9084203.1 bifunctional DNA-formamidopyrimidine glycosylase/DNA-(apurinic or apyrimidinic site) lyase [Pseudobdellovibrionaceae bacterium]
MPELPEVETVRLGLENLIPSGTSIESVERRHRSLREPIRPSELKKLSGQALLGFRRRAKYLLWETDSLMVVSHLGMTGSWRLLEGEPGKHDHLLVYLKGGPILAYNDPRRFGIFRVLPKLDWEKAPYFSQLGPEPLTENEFSPGYLFVRSRRKKVAVKPFLMDQRVVVGVGNIYASEALFRAGVKPTRAAGRITRRECARIVEACRQVLGEALQAGGTTIRDFRQAGGGEGYFAQKLLVYGRGGESCSRCKNPIKQRVIGGRSSFWCPSCQK